MSQKRRSPDDEPFLLIRSSAAGLPHGYELQRHRHGWNQLLFATAGVMTVETAAGRWVVPPMSAVWLPAKLEHAIRFTGSSELRTLYVRPGWPRGAAPGCAALAVTPLLRELIVRTTFLGALDRRDKDEMALAQLIFSELLAELGRLPLRPFNLPSPNSLPLRELVARLLANPSHSQTTPQLARKLGLSARTLERRFLEETGIGFFQWRKHARMLRALELLLLGTPLKQISAKSGYRGTSAFVAAFRETFATTPGRYLTKMDGARAGGY